MTVADLLRGLSDLPPDAVVRVEGCTVEGCADNGRFVAIRSVQVESGRVGERSITVRVLLTTEKN